ncbi:MAG: glycoside hydrolase family 88 protein [Salinirussus sp.]
MTLPVDSMKPSVKWTERTMAACRRERKELWIDAVDMFSPFLARYGVLADEPDAIDEAVQQIAIHAKHLHDDASGLYRHIWCEQPDFYPESSLWSRGNGWMLTGMADTLRVLPENHEGRAALEDRFVEHAAAIREVRDASGLWRNVLDDPHAPLEVSGACQFAHAFATGVQLDLLPEDYASLARETVEIVSGFVGNDGEVKRVALTPGGPGAPIGGGAQGQSWFLVAANTLAE